MAKDRSEKKEKKEKRKSVDGVKKEKKEKRKSTDATTALESTVEDAAPDAVDGDDDVMDVDDTVVGSEVPLGALVPFANPLCDDKAGKKVLKTVKKGVFFLFLS